MSVLQLKHKPIQNFPKNTTSFLFAFLFYQFIYFLFFNLYFWIVISKPLFKHMVSSSFHVYIRIWFINPLNPELNPICYLLALLGAHHFLHVSRIRVKLLTFRLLMSYIYGVPILDVSRSHTTTQHSR